MKTALQPWVHETSIMMQSVLMAAVRAPDGLRKDHPVKVLMRWYRRCVLNSAFDGGVLSDPFVPGGGSFTGPFERHHASSQLGYEVHPSDWSRMKDQLFDGTRRNYLRHVDEMPHHFQLHFMHAAQIVGYKHSDECVRDWWLTFYRMIVNDAHLFPESEELMDLRLSDSEEGWRAREEVTAR